MHFTTLQEDLGNTTLRQAFEPIKENYFDHPINEYVNKYEDTPILELIPKKQKQYKSKEQSILKDMRKRILSIDSYYDESYSQDYLNSISSSLEVLSTNPRTQQIDIAIYLDLLFFKLPCLKSFAHNKKVLQHKHKLMELSNRILDLQEIASKEQNRVRELRTNK